MDSNIHKEQDNETDPTTKYCEDCGKPGAKRPGVPWGQWRCDNCRRAKRCLLCGKPYDDCSC